MATGEISEEYRAAVRRAIRSVHESNKDLFNLIKTCVTECEAPRQGRTGKAPRRTLKQKAEDGLSAAALHLLTAEAPELNSLSTAQTTLPAKADVGERRRKLVEGIEESELNSFRASRNRRVLLLLVRHEVQVLMRVSDPANKHTAAKEQYARETGLSLEQVRQYCQDGSKYELLLQRLGPGVIYTLGAGKTLWEERLSKEHVNSLDVPLFTEQAKRWGPQARNFVCEEYRRMGGDPEELMREQTVLARTLQSTLSEYDSLTALVEAANAVESAERPLLQPEEDIFGVNWATNSWLTWDCYGTPPLDAA